MKKNNKPGQVLLGVLLLICIGAGGFYFFRAWKEEQPKAEAEQYYDSLRQEPFNHENQNQDSQGGAEEAQVVPGRTLPQGAVAWIWCPDTVIDYPVMQGTDNDYYLHHLPDGSKSDIGSIYLDAGSAADFTDDLSLVYGHHITRGRMFTSLINYSDPSYYEEHPVMYLYLANGTVYEVEIFAGEVADGGGIVLPSEFADPQEKTEFLEEKINRSSFAANVQVGAEDRLIALCTCTYEFQNARYILYGKLTLEENT